MKDYLVSRVVFLFLQCLSRCSMQLSKHKNSSIKSYFSLFSKMKLYHVESKVVFSYLPLHDFQHERLTFLPKIDMGYLLLKGYMIYVECILLCYNVYFLFGDSYCISLINTFVLQQSPMAYTFVWPTTSSRSSTFNRLPPSASKASGAIKHDIKNKEVLIF